MRILFFHPLTGHLWRGIERTVICLSSSLAEIGHDVTILTVRHPERALLNELDSRVTVVEAPYSRYYTYTFAIPFFTAHILHRRYDAVVTFFGGFGVGPSLRASSWRHSPRLYLCPAYPVDLAPYRYDEFERWGLPGRASGIWAQGSHVASQAAERFHTTVVPLPQGVNTERFRLRSEVRTATRARLGMRENDPLLLTVAALNERKGIQHVLHAMPRIQESFPGARYVVAGEGEYRGPLQDMINRLQLGDAVQLLGAQAHVEDLYNAADVFCLLSHGEANPLVVYEALASEVPVMTPDCPPFGDILRPEFAEILSSTDPETVATCLTNLLSDSARRTTMVRAGRKHVEDHHSFKSLAVLVAGLMQPQLPADLSGQPSSETTGAHSSL